MQIGRSPSFWRSCGIRAAALAVALLFAPPASQSDERRRLRQGAQRLQIDPGQRRAQIDAKQPLPNLPGQALYLARNSHDEHLQGSHRRAAVAHRAAEQVRHSAGLFRCRHRAADRRVRSALQHHAGAAGQCAELGDAVQGRRRSRHAPSRAPRASMPPPPTSPGRISLGIFFAETNGNQNIGNARSNNYKGSLQTGVVRGSQRPAEMGGAQAVDRGARSGADRARRQGGGAASAMATSATITGPRCATG